ncbi:1-deoxy-D-xylulose-5-phosphate synthase [Saxibacter everestensis]|uniref:1-deoxy-D-xylulose-5-phosphate synthase n=1 Tax=Saxibacter everestensis TaxID=2909229 RepID=A0ABY8R0M8_9MICO|nr:1-deoxy-D-xylulose-5-phosphate synthase [Brevibacteriaceae bacterium ZFBP1038]
MNLLDGINEPDDVKRLSGPECATLAEEIRALLVAEVSRTGGHLGPNLGVVELTMAIHRSFDSPNDDVLFDVGHQAYVHKILTGRAGDFATLRQRHGLSGYPSRAESPHDVIENSHASTALSWADGIAKAHQLKGEHDQHVVAVIGDGALTGGMAWEALNNIAADTSFPPRKLVIVVNDNGRSYAPTVGGMAHHLNTLRTTGGYEKFLSWGKQALQKGGAPGRFAYDALHGMKKGIKDVIAPQGLFEDLGLKYIGPVDGHDLAALEKALHQAKSYAGPVIVHALTEKGRGYAPALADAADQFHAVGIIDPETGESAQKKSTSWTSVFSDEIVEIADRRKDIVGITAAMMIPVGLHKFAAKYPERVFDVGIAEQHAVTSAAGLSHGGLHPVVCLYATFLNRGFDQLLMDVALHREGVTFVLDRAGVTGPDGASHHGMWDMAILQVVPGLHLAAPRDAARLREEVTEAVAIEDGPSVVRFSRGSVGADVESLERLTDGVDVLARGGNDVLIVSVGALAERALDVHGKLAAKGIGSTVIDPRWVLPVPGSVITLAGSHTLVAVIEDGVKVGGVGARVRQDLRAEGLRTGVLELGLPTEFLPHGTREEVLAEAGLDVDSMVERIIAELPEQLARPRRAG